MKQKTKVRCSIFCAVFFAYYHKFDFEKNIICPALGQVQFRGEHETLNAKIYVRDPFDSHASMINNISIGYFDKIRAAIENAVHILSTSSENDFILKIFGSNETSLISSTTAGSASNTDEPFPSSQPSTSVHVIDDISDSTFPAMLKMADPELIERCPPKCIAITFLPTDFENISIYMQDHLMCGNDNTECNCSQHRYFKKNLLSKFFIHFIVQILQIICKTERRFKFSFLPKETEYSKKIGIVGLYDQIYMNTA